MSEERGLKEGRCKAALIAGGIWCGMLDVLAPGQVDRQLGREGWQHWLLRL